MAAIHPEYVGETIDVARTIGNRVNGGVEDLPLERGEIALAIPEEVFDRLG